MVLCSISCAITTEDQVLRQKDLEKAFVLAFVSQSRGSAECEIRNGAMTLSASRGLGQQSFIACARPRTGCGLPRRQTHCSTSVSSSSVENLIVPALRPTQCSERFPPAGGGGATS